MGDGSVLQLDELTTIEIKPPKDAADHATINLPRGSAYFFNKGNSPEVNIETPSANGAIRGTAFVLTVRERQERGRDDRRRVRAFVRRRQSHRARARAGARQRRRRAGEGRCSAIAAIPRHGISCSKMISRALRTAAQREQV